MLSIRTTILSSIYEAQKRSAEFTAFQQTVAENLARMESERDSLGSWVIPSRLSHELVLAEAIKLNHERFKFSLTQNCSTRRLTKSRYVTWTLHVWDPRLK